MVVGWYCPVHELTAAFLVVKIPWDIRGVVYILSTGNYKCIDMIALA
jgi:hypothetical protein